MHDFAENLCPDSVAAPISVGSIPFREGEADRINGFCRCEAYYIFYVSEGSLPVCADFCEIPVNEGSLLVLPPGSVWRIQADTACSGKHVSFVPDSSCFTDNDIRFLRSAGVFCSFGKAHVIDVKAEPVGEILELLRNELDGEKRPYREETSLCLLRSLLYAAERQFLATRSDVPCGLARMFCMAVEEGFRVNRNADHYVNMLQINEKSLSRQLREVSGMTPKAYIDSRIVLEAKRMLACSKITVKEISGKLGFGEQSNFNKYFRKFTGVTPAMFRSALTDRL